MHILDACYVSKMLPALIVGGLTAWYLGVRPGIIAAIITFAALVVSSFVPGLTMAVYALVLAWCAALYFLGAKMTKEGGPKAGPSLGAATTVLGGLANQASSWLKKITGSDKSK
jgi:hypothetical protein